jgi:ribonuclease VapC
MIADSSALIAIALREPGYDVLRRKLAASSATAVGAPTLAEAKIVLTAKGQDAEALLGPILREAGIAIVPFGSAHHDAAVEAFARYGKRRHPAGLNFGDCLTYAVAKVAGEALLCKGGDFEKTDVDLA